MAEEQWPQPFWSSGRSAILRWCSGAPGRGSVKFQAALIEPTGAPAVKPREQLPLLFYFAGLGCLGGLGHLDFEGFARVAPFAFVLVAPLRQRGRWWTLSDDGDWGWVDGDFLPEMVQLLVDWMRALAKQPGADPSNLTGLGFSAGAYAITEILAHERAPLKGVLIGGVHGHGQPDMEGILGSKRVNREEEVRAKWQAYLDRLRHHRGAPRGIIGVHDRGDSVCPWPYAEEIYDTLNARQLQLRYRPVELKELNICRSRKNKSLHNYHDAALLDPDLIGRLLTRSERERHGAVPEASSRSAPSHMPRWTKKKRHLSPQAEPNKQLERHLLHRPSVRDCEHESKKGLSPVPRWSVRPPPESRARAARGMDSRSPARHRAAHAPKVEEDSSGFPAAAPRTVATPQPRARTTRGLHSPARHARNPVPDKVPESPSSLRSAAGRAREPAPDRGRESPTGRRLPAKRPREPPPMRGRDSPNGLRSVAGHARDPAPDRGRESPTGRRLPAKRPRGPPLTRGRESPRGSRSPAKRQREPACEMGYEMPDEVYVRIPAAVSQDSSRSRGPLAAGTPSGRSTADRGSNVECVRIPAEVSQASSLARGPLAGGTHPDHSTADDRSLLCANPSCWYQVHPEPEFGGFCCRKCHWRFVNNSKSKKKHGGRCLKLEPARTLQRAAPQTPERPL